MTPDDKNWILVVYLLTAVFCVAAGAAAFILFA